MADIDSNDFHLPAGDLASRLRTRRERLNLSRADLAARTKIPERHLSAIERGDFAALGGRAYAIGFTRTYARALGLDDKAIAGEVRAQLGEPVGKDERAASFEPGDPSRVPSRQTAWLAALAGVILTLGGSLYVWRSYTHPAAELPSLLSPDRAAGTVAPAGAAAGPAVSPRSAAPAGPVVLTATSDRVWIRVTDAAGTQLIQRELALNDSFTVPAEARGPVIRTARPDALRITIGGAPVPPLADHQTTISNVAISGPALLARANTGSAAGPAIGPAAGRSIASD